MLMRVKSVLRLLKLITPLPCGGVWGWGLVLLLASCTFVQEREPFAPNKAQADSILQARMDFLADSLYQAEITSSCSADSGDSAFVRLADVVSDIIQEIRYYSTFNFVGRRVPGYEAPVAWMTRQAADSLKAVSDELVAKGYRLKVFDAYRPQQAVLYFVGWARQASDTLMKASFYPRVRKDSLFMKGYISSRSAHARGSTIDLTLFDMQTEREVDMGGTYDLLDTISHVFYREGLTPDQIRHRMLLRESMMRHGFKPVRTEWWHFQLIDEPYPATSFDFPVR